MINNKKQCILIFMLFSLTSCNLNDYRFWGGTGASKKKILSLTVKINGTTGQVSLPVGMPKLILTEVLYDDGDSVILDSSEVSYIYDSEAITIVNNEIVVANPTSSPLTLSATYRNNTSQPLLITAIRPINDTSLTKSGYWYGANSFYSLNEEKPKALAYCSLCSDQSFSYTWIVDMDSNGLFDTSGLSADIAYHSESYAPNVDELGKNVRLFAYHDQLSKPLINDYIAKPVIKNIYSNIFSFAALRNDGTVLTWGRAEYGGDSSAVQPSLIGVKRLYTNPFASTFVALTNEGKAVAWGDSSRGGDSSMVSDQLIDIEKIFVGQYAVAALKSDKSVVVWGDPTKGGATDSGTLSQLTDVKDIYSTGGAFAALKNNGSVVIWGDPNSGGSAPQSILDKLTDVMKIYPNDKGFVALKRDGSAIGWGLSGTIPLSISSQLTDVIDIYSTRLAYAALKSDGSVVTWGDSNYGGDSNSVRNHLVNIQKIYSNWFAFTGLKNDNSVISWGHFSYGGNTTLINSQLKNISSITSSYYSFAALKNDRTVVSWGDESRWTASSPAILSQLNNAASIYSTSSAFTAMKMDNSLVVWGNSSSGGDPSLANGSLNNVAEVFSNYNTFISLKLDGSLVAWGDRYGSDISVVRPMLEMESESEVAIQRE